MTAGMRPSSLLKSMTGSSLPGRALMGENEHPTRTGGAAMRGARLSDRYAQIHRPVE
jgi:hypothetical protein